MNTPLVSIVVPIYNADRFLQKTIESVIQQTYTNWELLLIDDGSTDRSGEIAKKYLYDNRLQYFRHDNKGVSYSRNRGIELSKGKYIGFLDADDYFLPENIFEKVKMLETEKADWVFSDRYLTDEKGENLKVAEKGTGENILKKLLAWEGEVIPGPCCNLIIRKEFLLKYNLNFDTSLSTAADQDFSFRLAPFGKGLYLNKILWVYREVNFSMSRNISVMEKDHVAVYKKAKKNNLFENFIFTRKCFSNLYMILAGSWYKDAGSTSDMLRCALLSIWYYPPSVFKLIKKLS